jgi:hypothetical protein
MNTIQVVLEIGKTRTIASAVDWPGWCRSARDQVSALQALVDYGPRFALVLAGTDQSFEAPVGVSSIIVIEGHAGNATTDYGTPGVVVEDDFRSLLAPDLACFRTVVNACWQVLDSAAAKVAGRELRKGPRGGGRNLEAMLYHVLMAEQEYLKRLGYKPAKVDESNLSQAFEETRRADQDALERAARGELPKQGPRGGTIWPARFFVRRSAWHILDHAWEIEDRIL